MKIDALPVAVYLSLGGAAADQAAAAAGRPASSAATVLLVEDSDASRRLLQRTIGTLAYDVRTVATPGAALARRARDLRPGLPIVHVSGSAEHAAPAQSEFRLLQKPFPTHELADALREAIGGAT
jgi:DNA-binding LytR/AlgR family response regulator